MYGAPDRGGGREGKKSLRKTKQNLDAKVSAHCQTGIPVYRLPITLIRSLINLISINSQAKAIQKGHVLGASHSETTTAPPPPVCHAAGQSNILVDCGVQLINRQFDRDQLKVGLIASCAFYTAIPVSYYYV